VRTADGDDDAAAWQRLVERAAPDEHFQDWRWRAVMQDALDHRPLYLLAERAGGITGCLPLVEVESRLFGRSLVSLPFLNGGGALALDRASLGALLDHAARLVRTGGCRFGELRQRAPLADDLRLPCRSHKVAMRLRLDADPERLFQGFKAKLRSQIRRPTKDGAVAEVIDGRAASEPLIEAFYRVFAENMRDLGTPVFPLALFRETLAAFGKDAALVLVRLDGLPVAGGLLVGARARGPDAAIEMIWASSLRRYNRHAVNMLAYWEAMRYAVAAGYGRFDFGRSSPDAPTYRFKAQWGALPLPLPWYYVGGGEIPDISPDNPKFRLAVRAWQHLPLWLANRLGPPLARGLP
jgi:FemAB-related protein (PEP-CTERM system-associated)